MKITNSDHLLNILAMGVPARISVELDFEVNRPEPVAVVEKPAEGTFVSKKVFGELQAKFDALKFEHQEQAGELKEVKKVGRKMKRQLKDLTDPPMTERKKGRGTRLIEQEVWRVRRLIKIGRTDRWISEQMDIAYNVVNRIRNELSYKSVPEEEQRKPVLIRVGHGELK